MDIINSYEKLPLGMYLDITALCEDKEMDDDDRQMEIISILSGISVDGLLKMPITQFKKLAAETRFLEEEFPHVNRRIPKEYKYEEMTLVVTTDITKMTTAQYVDFQSFSEMGKVKLVELLSCFFVPKGMEYNEGYDVREVQDVLRRRLSVAEALTLSAFFLNRWLQLTQATLIYSGWIIKRMRKVQKERKTELTEEINRLLTDLQSSGDGWTMLCQWLRLPRRNGVMSGR